jgi:hypothetical protein
VGWREIAIALRGLVARRRDPVAFRPAALPGAAAFGERLDGALRAAAASPGPGEAALALAGLLEGRLEDLTPELPDLADRAWHRPQSYDRGPRRRVDDGHMMFLAWFLFILD